jgi:hypothetical protein
MEHYCCLTGQSNRIGHMELTSTLWKQKQKLPFEKKLIHLIEINILTVFSSAAAAI